MRHFAGVQHHFVDGGADTFLAILLTHLGLQQKAFLGDVVAFQHVGELLQGVVRVKVGEKAEVAAVNADNVNVVTGQGPRRAEHIAVAAHHHREVGLLANLRQRAGFHVAELKFMGDLLFNQHFIPFAAQPAPEHFMCGQGGGVTRMSHNADTLEMVLHDLDVLALNEIVTICPLPLKPGN